MESLKYLLVIGGHGALGDAIIEAFKNEDSSWQICVLDLQISEKADKNIIIEKIEKFSEEPLANLCKELQSFSKKFDAIFNVARGYVRGSIRDPKIFLQSDEMFSKNYYFSLLGNNINYDKYSCSHFSQIYEE